MLLLFRAALVHRYTSSSLKWYATEKQDIPSRDISAGGHGLNTAALVQQLQLDMNETWPQYVY